MSRKWISLAVILVVVAAIAVAALRHFRHSRVHPNTDDAYVAGDIFPVASRVPGTLLTVDVDENQSARKGQTVAVLDSRDADLAVEQAKASLEEARSALATARAEIAQARARVAADGSRLTLARTNLTRFTELTRRDSVPRARYDDAVAAEGVASADHAASEKALAAKEASLGVAQRRVAVQETRLSMAETTRSYCTVVAPVEGIVSKLTAQPGQVVAPGQPLCAIVPLGPRNVWVAANFKETELHSIRVGQPATFHADADPDREYRGWVESLSAGTGSVFSLLPPENATGNWVKIVQRLPVRIAVDPASDADGSLRLGLSVHVEIDTLAPPHHVPAAGPPAAPAPAPTPG